LPALPIVRVDLVEWVSDHIVVFAPLLVLVLVKFFLELLFKLFLNHSRLNQRRLWRRWRRWRWCVIR